MNYKNINFVLVNPQLGENIGSCARALKNFGFKRLNLINPTCNWPNEKAKATSVGAKDIINSVRIYKTLEEATSKDDLVIAMSSRVRNTNKKFIKLKELRSKIKKYKNISILFGPEASGLSNKDISLANNVIKIPNNPKFESINLSHSVILVCYEIFNNINQKDLNFKSSYSSNLANKNSINIFVKRLIKSLDKVGFLQPRQKRDSMIININNIFHRFDLSDQELHILQGIFTNLQNRKK